jgi:biopolymer transport protein ExbD
MFFLMLFFLIVSTMITPGAIKLALPQADKSPQMNKQTEKIAISVTKDLKYYLNDKQIQFSQIEAELLKIKKGRSICNCPMRQLNCCSVDGRCFAIGK